MSTLNEMLIPLRLNGNYGFVRSRQLEGTYPGDRKTGIWPITSQRVAFGWGAVREDDWPREENAGWPLVEPPGLDTKAKKLRVLRYQRVRSAREARAALAAKRLVSAAFEITNQWFEAPNGVITMPPPGATVEGSHAVTLTGYDDLEGVFSFANTWGPGWGNQGYGVLSYEFFERWMIDTCVRYGLENAPLPHLVKGLGVQLLPWAFPDFAGRVMHVREFYDKDNDERMAWTFAVQRNGVLEVEEFYVRPQYRKQGYGRNLMNALRELSDLAKLPLRFWIPFADCDSANLTFFERLLAPLGFSLQLANVRWAAYRTDSRPGVQRPALPTPPSRPALCRPRKDLPINGELLAGFPSVASNGEQIPETEPVSEAVTLLQEPDWKTESDEAFREAAKSVFVKNAALLKRLA